MALCTKCGKSLYLDRLGLSPRGLCVTIAPPTDADDTGLCRACKQEIEYEAIAGPFDYEEG